MLLRTWIWGSLWAQSLMLAHQATQRNAPFYPLSYSPTNHSRLKIDPHWQEHTAHHDNSEPRHSTIAQPDSSKQRRSPAPQQTEPPLNNPESAPEPPQRTPIAPPQGDTMSLYIAAAKPVLNFVLGSDSHNHATLFLQNRDSKSQKIQFSLKGFNRQGELKPSNDAACCDDACFSLQLYKRCPACNWPDDLADSLPPSESWQNAELELTLAPGEAMRLLAIASANNQPNKPIQPGMWQGTLETGAPQGAIAVLIDYRPNS